MPRRPSPTAGFTLLELLVVIVIIGVLATMLTLSIGITGGDRDLEREAERLQALVTVASEDALIRGRELGLRFYRGGYEFVVLNPDENRWERAAGDDVMRPRKLPDDLTLELEVDGREVVLGDAPDTPPEDAPEAGDGDDDEQPDYSPQVYIFSSGDVTPPFTARLRRQFASDGLSVVVAADGTAELERDDP